MDEIERDPLSQLAWVAFLAEQLGWTELADRISEDLAAAQERALAAQGAQPRGRDDVRDAGDA
jgi:hypothetical protein